MALTRKSRTAMDILKSDIGYISTYSKKIDEMLGRINGLFYLNYFEFYRWWYSYGCYNRTMWKSWKWKIKFMVC
jgi:hypothetical protein